MALEIAIAVATGGNCLGELQCEQGEVLFLALEDNRRRMQRRTTKLLGAHKADWPHIATYHKWPRADQGGADALRKWMLDYPATRLIVVDVLAQFRKPSPPGKQSYELDYEAVAQLQSIAAENAGLAIIVVHHLRKSEAGDDVLDTVSGTLGTNAAADAIVILHKTAQGMSLYGRSRDVDEIDKAVEFDRETCRWRVLGERDEVQRSEDQQAILYLLRKEGELRLHDIAKALDRSESTVHRQLGKLLGAGPSSSRSMAAMPQLPPEKVVKVGKLGSGTFQLSRLFTVSPRAPARESPHPSIGCRRCGDRPRLCKRRTRPPQGEQLGLFPEIKRRNP